MTYEVCETIISGTNLIKLLGVIMRDMGREVIWQGKEEGFSE